MISKITSKIQGLTHKIKRNKEHKIIDNFVTIHSDKINKSAFDQIKQAQKTMYNYVKNYGVGLDIYDAEQALLRGANTRQHLNESLSNKLLVKATNLLTGFIDEKLVSANTEQVNKHIIKGHFIIDIPSEGLQYAQKTENIYEDNFLRNLYRNIEEMTENIAK